MIAARNAHKKRRASERWHHTRSVGSACAISTTTTTTTNPTAQQNPKKNKYKITMKSFSVYAAVLLMMCCACDAADHVTSSGTVDGPSLTEISRIVESSAGYSSPFELFDTPKDDGPAEGRGKKPKPGRIAMVMAVSAGVSMLMMKAMAAVKLFIIHSFLATKLGLIIGAYLLACKLMEMKQPPPKKVVKWVSAPVHFDEHSAPSMISNHYPDSQSSYEPPIVDHHQQQEQPAEQYGPPPPVHQPQFMPSSGDFGGGGGGDMQAHYSHISPVTYRPMINRNQSENQAKSSAGRLRR